MTNYHNDPGNNGGGDETQEILDGIERATEPDRPRFPKKCIGCLALTNIASRRDMASKDLEIITETSKQLFDGDPLNNALRTLLAAVQELKDANNDGEFSALPAIGAMANSNESFGEEPMSVVPIEKITISRYDTEKTLREKLIASLFGQKEYLEEALSQLQGIIDNAGSDNGCSGLKKLRAQFPTGTFTPSICTNPEIIGILDGDPMPVVIGYSAPNNPRA